MRHLPSPLSSLFYTGVYVIRFTLKHSFYIVLKMFDAHPWSNLRVVLGLYIGILLLEISNTTRTITIHKIIKKEGH